jgi:membrane-associated protein
LLLTAGLLASRGILNEFILVPGLFIAAVLGDQVGYWFGAKTGPLIFNRENSLLFRRKNLLAAKAFYEKHGGKTVTLARFLPFIRTFAPIVAGAAEMNYKRFVMFNLLGGFLWAICVTLLGYGLGKAFGSIEGIDKYFTLLVIAFFFIPGLPTLIHLWNDNKDDILAWVKKRLARKQAPEA